MSGYVPDFCELKSSTRLGTHNTRPDPFLPLWQDQFNVT